MPNGHDNNDHSRRREDDFGWVRRNWQFITALVWLVAVATGVYYRTGTLEDRIDANDTRDTAQWQRIGEMDRNVDSLRDRVSRMEGHH